ncbi:12121_t:CDS:10 [Ambispora gerdemannii]|uniref:12121_t:CDS:1 n=1 Tax=Ambispora gerdemannii TaxID=144530 RepID=A0A9N9FH66_9GLOM|nr:12121_t:CDS:10 [Ambispora gerdemannii]
MTNQEKKPDSYTLLQEPEKHVEIAIDEQDDDKSSNGSSKGSNIFKDFANKHLRCRKEKSSDAEFYIEKYGIKRICLVKPDREVYLLLDGNDVTAFLEMQGWINNNPHKSLEQTITEFEQIDKADAFAKILYDHPLPDFILKFPNEEDVKNIVSNTERRFKFEWLLLKAGLVVEREEDISSDNTYIKIWAPFHRLCKEAHHMRIKLPLNVNKVTSDFELVEERLSSIRSRFSRKIDTKKESAFFKKDKLRQFKGAELDKDFGEIALNFWNGAKRNYLTHHIIITANQIKTENLTRNESSTFTKRRIRSLDIKALLKDHVYTTFFTLHDGPVESLSTGEQENLRSKLYRTWVKRYGKQPLEEIREYFGERLGLYFAWLGFYTTWLTIPGILGFITVIFGLIRLIIVKHGFYGGVQGISTIWDNELTFPYALAISIWATCFLESWKRFNAALVYDWDTSDFEREERPRPEFKGTVFQKSPITSKQELTFPFKEQIKKLIVSSTIIIASICIVTITIGVLLTFSRAWINIGLLSNVIASFVNLATVLILNLVYERLAVWLTDYENHRTSTLYEDSLTLKIYLFDFVNFYSALFYILLFKRKFVRAVVNEFHDEEDGCQYQSCMAELTIQLAIILIGKQTVGQIQEIFIPLLRGKINRAGLKKELVMLAKAYETTTRKLKTVPQWIWDNKLAPVDNNIRSEYQELGKFKHLFAFEFIQTINLIFFTVVQYGFISLFATAFPLAPFFAWLNNVSEIRSDAFKYIKALRRPVGFQAQDLGMWEQILHVVSLLAVITNATIIAFHSSYMREHFVFFIKALFAYAIPDVPKSVRIAIERERYLTRIVLEGEESDADECDDEKEDNNNKVTNDEQNQGLKEKEV